MGDFSRVLPLTGSPLHYIATVSYEKCKQSLEPIGSICKKISWRAAFGGVRARNPSEDESVWWIYFSLIPVYCMLAVVTNFLVDPGSKLLFFAVLFCTCGFIFHFVAVYSVIYWYRNMSFQLIGANAKFMVEVIPMITAAALHHLLDFNYGYLALLLACTTYFYSFAHFMHITYDIGGIDVLLGIVMQVLAYMLNTKLLVRALALSLFFGLCLYRYMTYCTPQVPPHRKKELKQMPC